MSALRTTSTTDIPRRDFTKLHSFLNELYLNGSHEEVELAADDSLKKLLQKVRKAFDEAVKHVRDNKRFSADNLTDTPVKKLISATYETLGNAVDLGIEQKVPEIMRQALMRDAFFFSGMKVYTSLREVGDLPFTDKNGNTRSWNDFKQDADKLNVKYNENYLQTEYGFAKRSAQSAANWQSLNQDTDRYLLQYRTAEDDKVRKSHADMDNITLPKTDSFWNNYYPPNGWNCRCVAIEVRSAKYNATDHNDAMETGNKTTTSIGKDGSNKLAMFRFNPGKSKKIFPPEHPYTSGDCGKLSALWTQLSRTERIGLANEADKCRAKKIETEIADSTKPKKIKHYENGGELYTYPVLENKKADDYENVLDAANYFAKHGDKMQILPQIRTTNDPRYDIIFGALKGTKYYGKNPDILRNGLFYEHEGFKTKNAKRALRNMLNRGLKQSDKVIIEDCGLTDRYMKFTISNRVRDGQYIEEVWLKKGNKLTLLYKRQKPNE